MVRTYRALNKKSRNRTLRGGSIESVKTIISDTQINNIQIINPNCKFVVATYWWGIQNINQNLQKPCPSDINELLDKALQNYMIANPAKFRGFPVDKTEQRARLKNTERVRPLTKREKQQKELLDQDFNDYITEIKTKNKDLLNNLRAKIREEELAKPGSHEGKKFSEMIKDWEEKCRNANVNYVSVNTEFPREDYQNAINGKPFFIKKILDAVAPRAVLYIDGDMWINKYPHIFDIDNVDFMARSWNIDSRSSERGIKLPFYDPYTFETSGGTMYFGNTRRARDLLDIWEAESAKPINKGKADDRILSQLITVNSSTISTNILGLPIEYLWLTLHYEKFLNSLQAPASIEDAYIEHPACLTAEETAADQGAASNRTPEGYEEEVTDNIRYNRPTELIYEYIFFDGKRDIVQEFSRYHTFMSNAINDVTKAPLMEIIKFDDKYGKYNDIAKKNISFLTPRPPNSPGFITRGNIPIVSRQNAKQNVSKVTLPLNAPIPEILKALYNNTHVEIGDTISGINPEDEMVVFDISKTPVDSYTRTIEIDITKPMFISCKSNIVKHLLVMCETLADINKHVNGSYMFMSRIRWKLLKGDTSTKKQKQIITLPPQIQSNFPLRVNQIWFGANMPSWRQQMFDANKEICEEYGFKYSLWKDQDRTKENFEITFDYQNTAIQAGNEIGQNRLAQVADLARLEIIYNVGGIYIDSLIEITPAFLKAVVDAIKEGKTFIGCNEDPCNPPTDCVGNAGRKYLSNSFFAATKGHPILKNLLTLEKLDSIDFSSEFINRTTGPYYLREGLEGVDMNTVFMFDSSQIYPFNQQPTPYKENPVPNRFLSRTPVPGSIKVKDDMYYLPGGAEIMQSEFLVKNKGPLAIYHSGLGGTWST
jgi:mannosyltransferase OCH1-like enzyme